MTNACVTVGSRPPRGSNERGSTAPCVSGGDGGAVPFLASDPPRNLSRASLSLIAHKTPIRSALVSTSLAPSSSPMPLPAAPPPHPCRSCPSTFTAFHPGRRLGVQDNAAAGNSTDRPSGWKMVLKGQGFDPPARGDKVGWVGGSGPSWGVCSGLGRRRE
jgi:hypothetical protein